MFKTLLRRVLNAQTSEHQQKLIQHLSETELMTKAARATHQVVQKVSAHVEEIAKGGPIVKLPNKSDKTTTKNNNVPLHHEELTESDHAAARGGGGGGMDLFGTLRRAREQVKSDAAADWQDLKKKFSRK